MTHNVYFLIVLSIVSHFYREMELAQLVSESGKRNEAENNGRKVIEEIRCLFCVGSGSREGTTQRARYTHREKLSHSLTIFVHNCIQQHYYKQKHNLHI